MTRHNANTPPLLRLACEGEQPPSVKTAHSSLRLLKYRTLDLVGRWLQRIRMPGQVAEAEIHDPLTGQHIRIKPGRLLTRITVNGRDYYFTRITGRFDGTGSGCT